MRLVVRGSVRAGPVSVSSCCVSVSVPHAPSHTGPGGGTSRKDSGEGGKTGDNRGITLELVLIKIKIKLDLPASYKKSRVLKKVVTKTNEKFKDKDYFTSSPPVLPFPVRSNEKAATQHTGQQGTTD